MELGNHLFEARKNKGLSQEEVAQKLGVSRQTISKWELNETFPDIRQSKKLAILYNLTLDELIDFDVDVDKVQDMIENTSEETINKIDWTKVWSKQYPILAKYQDEVDINFYAKELTVLLNDLEKTYHYNQLDAMLVLKDILARVWKSRT